MYERLIQSYIEKLQPSDITRFASKYGIELNDDEVTLLYGQAKNNWHTILYGNPREILDELKHKMKPFNYQKIEQLYIHFKEKYQNYL